ncbi:YtxH domain-containing protein [Myroides pelagicus]|uniref:YtxH domain-containing protein n=1 Tax=Myroides pelagicus TaxID=270914 RepID=A0A7K1GKY1_9FLAO|nr:YtxH domain-containing protein [Myroides pelagicus]MEC4113233.1 YtxH domain-containing protein [Myroides pelagicus]MTH29400.1 YtxH domain-containing protein [Myroides pelagicus]
MSNKVGGTVLAVLAGVAVGASLGILFAPEEGKKTRKKIKKTFDDSKEDLEDKIDELKKQVRTVVNKKKHDIEESLDHFVHSSGKKRDEVIASLEEKLAALKSQANEVTEDKHK